MESRFKIQDLELGEIVISLKVMKISKFLVTAGAFAFSGLVSITSSAYAGYTCDTDYLGRQVCRMDNGGTYTIDKDYLGRDRVTGSDGSRMTCDTDYLGRYRCN